MLRAAQPSDFAFLRGLSPDPSDEALQRQMRGGQLRIIEVESEADGPASWRPVGFLKFAVLWETLPFIEVIWLAEQQRSCGLGRQAVTAWEAEMRGQGFDLVLTSTAADATAQHFWRKLGYTDCGSLTVRRKPAEIFLQKALM